VKQASVMDGCKQLVQRRVAVSFVCLCRADGTNNLKEHQQLNDDQDFAPE